MNEALVVVELGESGWVLPDVSAHAYVFAEKTPDGSAEELEGKLTALYREFKTGRVERVRYILFCAARNPASYSIVEALDIVAGVHRQSILIPYETDVFILLPSIRADPAELAGCYRFFEDLENLPAEREPELFWLFDPDRMPADRAGEIVAQYLSADVTRAFVEQLRAGRAASRKRCYGFMGLARLFFPAEAWQEYLALKLTKDLLETKPLSAPKETSETAAAAAAQASLLLRENAGRLTSGILRPADFPGADVLLEGLAAEEEKSIDEFRARLDLHMDRETSERWQNALPLTESFVKNVGEELASILDSAPHAPYAARSLIGLLLESGGPSVESLGDSRRGGEKNAGASVNGFLFGWQGDAPSPVLERLLHEVSTMLRELCREKNLPFPESRTWQDLATGLRELQEAPERDKAPGDFLDFINGLAQRTASLLESLEHPYGVPFTEERLKNFVAFLEEQDLTRLRSAMAAAHLAKEQVKRVSDGIAALGWEKWLPASWPRFSIKRAKQAELEKTGITLREAYVAVLDRRKGLFPCYCAIFMANRVSARLAVLEEKLNAFISRLENEREWIERKIGETQMPSPPFGFPVVDAGNRDEFAKLYGLRPGSREAVPDQFSDFLSRLIGPEEGAAGLSYFCGSSGKQEKFFNGMEDYARRTFAWIREWSAGKVVAFLKKEAASARILEENSFLFPDVKEFPATGVRSALFVGMEEEGRNPFVDTSFPGTPPFYHCHGRPEVITGLRLAHGLPSSAIEGWEYWKAKAATGDSPGGG